MKRQNPIIYVDEAGNTGSDILNQQQQYFVLASVNFSDDELKELQTATNYSKEFHFVKMKKNAQGRKALKTLLQHPLMNKEHIYWVWVDKKFCLYAEMTDIIIESVFYARGKNLYNKRGNIILANVFSSFATNFSDKALIELFENSFVEMMRTKSENSIEEFYGLVGMIKNKAISEFADILSIIEDSRNLIKKILYGKDKYVLDTTVTSLFILIEHWYNKFQINLNILTDDSKQIQEHESLIRKLINIKDSQAVGYDTRVSHFPLPVNSLNMVDSKNYFGIQMADIIASAVSFVLNDADKYKSFQDEIKNYQALQVPCFSIQPSSIEKLMEPVDDSNDIDPIEYLIEQLS